MTTTENDALSKALKIHLIFDRIFDHLPYSDVIQNCSVISKSWNAAATHYLDTLSIFQVTVGVNDSPNLEVRVTERLKRSDNGEKNSPKFKVHTFTQDIIQNFGDKLKEHKNKKIWLSINYRNKSSQNGPCEELMSQLIHLTLPWVTRLSIMDGRLCGNNPKKFWTPIQSIYVKNGQHAPQLDHLCMGELLPEFRIDAITSSSCSSIPLDILGQIRILQFGPNYRHSVLDNTKMILGGCSNVESILYFPLDYIHALTGFPAMQSKLMSINYHKLPLIAHDDCTEKMIQLASYCGHLKLVNLTLSIVQWNPRGGKKYKKKVADTNFKKCCQIFSKILNSSQGSIRKLEIWPLQTPQILQWPLEGLPKLWKLVLVMTEAGKGVKSPRGFFPPNFQLQNTFPVLNVLEISGIQEETSRELLTDQIFLAGSSSSLVCLKKLKLRNKKNFSSSHKFIEKMATFFPQIVILDVIGIDPPWLQNCLPIIWTKWPKLEQLFINFEGAHSHFWLDESMTGIPEEICSKLRNSELKMDDDDFVLESVKSRPGISDMKYLTQLSITFSGNYLKKCFLVSDVSSLFGFQLVPHLKVNFSIQTSTGQDNFCEDLTKIQ